MSGSAGDGSWVLSVVLGKTLPFCSLMDPRLDSVEKACGAFACLSIRIHCESNMTSLLDTRSVNYSIDCSVLSHTKPSVGASVPELITFSLHLVR